MKQDDGGWRGQGGRCVGRDVGGASERQASESWWLMYLWLMPTVADNLWLLRWLESSGGSGGSGG
jgi:hypothetical protein